jgi:hypothetical protein
VESDALLRLHPDEDHFSLRITGGPLRERETLCLTQIECSRLMVRNSGLILAPANLLRCTPDTVDPKCPRWYGREDFCTRVYLPAGRFDVKVIYLSDGEYRIRVVLQLEAASIDRRYTPLRALWPHQTTPPGQTEDL